MAVVKEWIAGRNPVYEVMLAGRRQINRLLVAVGAEEKGRLAEIIQMAAKIGLPVDRVPRQRLDAYDENPQGVALEVSEYPYVDLQDMVELAEERGEDLFLLALDLIQNPQNLGTLLRTAEAAGVHGVLLPLARAATVTPAVVHASAGASEHLLITQANLAQAVERLKKTNAWVVGLDGGPQAQPVEQVRLDGPLVVVVGNEGEGMRPLTRKACDVLARLPMHGRVESLNAAVAGSIVLYLVQQARAKKK